MESNSTTSSELEKVRQEYPSVNVYSKAVEQSTSFIYRAHYNESECSFEIFQKEINSEAFQKEMEILKKTINHDHVLNIATYFASPRPAILTNGLRERLSRHINNRPFFFSNAAKMISGIAKGVQYLHSKNIIHINLLSTNIEVDEGWKPLICGYGFSKFIDPISLGKSWYRAPELLEGRVDFPVDVYSIGVILWEMLSGRVFYSVTSLIQAQSHLQNFRNDWNPILSKLIWQSWSKSPHLRPTIEEVIERAESIPKIKGCFCQDKYHVFNDSNLLKKFVNNDGIKLFKYESVFNKVSEVYCIGKSFSWCKYSYDASGNLVFAMDSKGRAITRIFNSNGNCISSIDHKGNRLRLTYGNVLFPSIPTKIETDKGNAEYQLNSLGDVVSVQYLGKQNDIEKLITEHSLLVQGLLKMKN